MTHKYFVFSCCHHICEVILSHVWDSLEIEPSKAPTINIFKKLQDHWSKINCTNMSSLYQPIAVEQEQLIGFYKRSIGADFLIENLPWTCSIVSYLFRDWLKHLVFKKTNWHRQSKIDVHNFIFKVKLKVTGFFVIEYSNLLFVLFFFQLFEIFSENRDGPPWKLPQIN